MGPLERARRAEVKYINKKSVGPISPEISRSIGLWVVSNASNTIFLEWSTCRSTLQRSLQKSLQKSQTKRLRKIIAKTESSAKSEVVVWPVKQGNDVEVAYENCTKQVIKGIEVRRQRLSEAEQVLNGDYNRRSEKILEIKYKATLGKGGKMKFKNMIKNKRGSMAGGRGS